MNKPKILTLDIETRPLLVYAWGTFDQNISLDMIKEDWCVLSWAAKWLHESDVMYMDQRNKRNINDDKATVKAIWKLIDEADIIVSQNGKSFDMKKLNERFLYYGLGEPSSFKHVDTKRLMTKKFAATSNKLEYLSSKYNEKYQKIKHEKYPGFKLWSECMGGNMDAWKDMEKYNKHDVLATEELYLKLRPWDNQHPNMNLYNDEENSVCPVCGSHHLQKRGFAITTSARYQRYQCQDCGHFSKGGSNLLSKDKKQSIRKNV